MPGPNAALADPNFLTEVGQIAQLTRADGDAVELRQQAERSQFANAMRQDVDADAELLHFRGRLEDSAGNVELMQGQRQRQSPDAASRDQDVHGLVRRARRRHRGWCMAFGFFAFRLRSISSSCCPAARRSLPRATNGGGATLQ